MSTTELERVAIHEAGHSFAAYQAGRRPGPVTIRPGKRWAGVSYYTAPTLSGHETERIRADLDRPYLLWPASIRRKLDIRALVTAAGEQAENTLHQAGTTRRIPDLLTDALDAATIAPPTRAEKLQLALARDDTAGLTDAENLANLLTLLYPGDIPTGAAWLAHITAQARAIITNGAPAVLRLADALLTHHELSGRAVRTILAAP